MLNLSTTHHSTRQRSTMDHNAMQLNRYNTTVTQRIATQCNKTDTTQIKGSQHNATQINIMDYNNNNNNNNNNNLYIYIYNTMQRITTERNTMQRNTTDNLVPRVLSLPPSRKYPGFGWSRISLKQTAPHQGGLAFLQEAKGKANANLFKLARTQRNGSH